MRTNIRPQSRSLMWTLYWVTQRSPIWRCQRFVALSPMAVRLRALEVRVDELVTPAPPGCVHHGNVPSFGPAFDPLLELFGDAAQHIPAHRVEPPVGIEETDDPLRLLERLDQAVQQDAVEAAIVEPDAVLVMIEEGVHPAPAENQ